MKTIGIIIKREYLSRVRKKSFVVMTILGPIFMAALMIVPLYIAKLSDEVKQIGIVDETHVFYKSLKNSNTIKFDYLSIDIEQAKTLLTNTDKYHAILYLPAIFVNSPSSVKIFAAKQPSFSVQDYIKNSLHKALLDFKLEQSTIDKEELQRIYKLSELEMSTVLLKEGKEEKAAGEGLIFGLAIFSGILIYSFIFMFGVQVMRGVIEEKTNRIVEIIVSSLKPFQLMMGKIAGVALVALTQFMLWIVLTVIIIGIVQVSFPETFKIEQTQQFSEASNQLMSNDVINTIKSPSQSQFADTWNQMINSIDFGVMVLMFVFYFLGGYLLYAALFAAIGSAVDNEADTQQFMMPVTIPLIFAIVMSSFVINNPQGPVAFWLSIIPFTSPITMMMRIPFGVNTWELLLSAGLLILFFLTTTWIAARIYRTGILMYGKKPSFKELGKWMFYK